MKTPRRAPGGNELLSVISFVVKDLPLSRKLQT